MNANADQVAYWNETAGAKWVANQARLDRVFAPLTDALMRAAAPRSGERVLDVGCGCGQTSLLAAAAVGPNGHVLAIDLSAPMLAHAAGRVATADAPITWLQADAMTHVFAGQADLLMSRFGVMFFADPAAAFRNLRSALKPGGRFAFLCWQPRPLVGWMQWPLEQVASILAIPEATTGQVGPFGLADAGMTSRVLGDAGFVDLTIKPIHGPLLIGEGDDPVADAMALLCDTGPVAALLREAPPADRAKSEALLRDALARQVHDGVIRLSASCWLYEGRA